MNPLEIKYNMNDLITILKDSVVPGKWEHVAKDITKYSENFEELFLHMDVDDDAQLKDILEGEQPTDVHENNMLVLELLCSAFAGEIDLEGNFDAREFGPKKIKDKYFLEMMVAPKINEEPQDFIEKGKINKE